MMKQVRHGYLLLGVCDCVCGPIIGCVWSHHWVCVVHHQSSTINHQALTSFVHTSGEDQEETGWKYIHGDVFRFPPHLNLFCAAIGTGTQIFVMALCIFALGLLQTFHPTNRGALLAACVVLYALTAGTCCHGKKMANARAQMQGHVTHHCHTSLTTTTGVAGYVAGASYKVMGGTNWVRNVLLTCVLFCGPMLVMFSFLNTVAFAYGSTQALPWQTIVIIILLWALVTFPLTVLGGIAGISGHLGQICCMCCCHTPRPLLAQAKTPRQSLMHHAEQPSIPVRSLHCPGIVPHHHRWLWPGFCHLVPSTSSCTTSLRACGATRTMWVPYTPFCSSCLSFCSSSRRLSLLP